MQNMRDALRCGAAACCMVLLKCCLLSTCLSIVTVYCEDEDVFFSLSCSSCGHILLKVAVRFLAFLLLGIVSVPKVKIHVGASRRGAAELLH